MFKSFELAKRSRTRVYPVGFLLKETLQNGFLLFISKLSDHDSKNATIMLCYDAVMLFNISSFKSLWFEMFFQSPSVSLSKVNIKKAKLH